MKCPKDGGDLAERRTEARQGVLRLLRYPACDFVAWNKPVAETCPECGWVGMEKRVNKTRGETRAA